MCYASAVGHAFARPEAWLSGAQRALPRCNSSIVLIACEPTRSRAPMKSWSPTNAGNSGWFGR
jgi:hypothetical protein